MVGPGDRTDRFMHWPLRLSKPGEVLVPGKITDRVQYADIRDIAEFMIRLLEDRKSGIFNAVGPKETQHVLEFVKEASTVFEAKHTYTMVDDYQFLEQNEIFFSIPWVIPNKDHLGTAGMSTEKIVANGMTYRSLEQTIKDTYDWWHSDAVEKERRENYASNTNSLINREQDLLKSWSLYKN